MKRDVRAKVDNDTYLWIKDIVRDFPDLTVSSLSTFAIERLRETVTDKELAGLADRMAAQRVENKKAFMGGYGTLRSVK